MKKKIQIKNKHKVDKELGRIYHKVGLKYNLKDEEVVDVIDSMYHFIFSKINDNDLTELDTLDGVKTNFIIKYFGKFHSNNKLLERYKKRRRNGKEKL